MSPDLFADWLPGGAMDALTAAAFAGTVLIVLSVRAVLAGVAADRRRKQRIANARHRAVAGATAPAKAKATASVKFEEKTGVPVFDRLAKRVIPRQELLRQRIRRTGREIPLGTYLFANVALGLVTGLAARFVFEAATFVAVAVGIGVGIGLPHYVLGVLAARRAAKFNAVFPDSIDLIVRGLRSGLPVSESIAAVGREMPAPVGPEFRRVMDAVRLGQSLEDALWDLSKRLATPEFNFFVISLSVQKDTGGNLAETLANLSDILRQRRQMRLKIRAMSSEARASAMILGGLPFLMFGIIFMIAPDYEMALFTDPRGKMMLGAGLGIMSIGILVMRKMVRFEI